MDDIRVTISGQNFFIATEYCTRSYSKEDFKFVKYAKPIWNNREEWNWKYKE